MFKDVLNHANLTLFAEIGLAIFFVVFVLVVVRTFTQPRREVDRWSKMPLNDDAPMAAQSRSRAHE